jgi:hypothetical protein
LQEKEKTALAEETLFHAQTITALIKQL